MVCCAGRVNEMRREGSGRLCRRASPLTRLVRQGENGLAGARLPAYLLGASLGRSLPTPLATCTPGPSLVPSALRDGIFWERNTCFLWTENSVRGGRWLLGPP